MHLDADISRVWDSVLGIMKEELSEPVFKTWFENTVPLELTDEGVFVVGVGNEFSRSWLEDRYAQRLGSALRQVLDFDASVKIVVESSHFDQTAAEQEPAYQELPAVETAPRVEQPSYSQESPAPFDPRQTFDSFVVGDTNEFARNAALAVAEQPGLRYNPLFIWGGPGLGKTHLLQAIGNYVISAFPHKKVMFVTSETFISDFLASISAKTGDSFRRKYRGVDVLLIDDIQFLEKKQTTLEQFFHTFNELRQRGKAVVLASDRPPKDLNFDERYTSRLASGLQADIQPPTYETRLVILRQLVEAEKLPVEDEVLAFIAERSTPNIREMEGALHRIKAFRDLSKKPVVDVHMAEQVTRDLFPDQTHRPVSISTIQREVCRYYSVSHSDLIGGKRSQSIVYPRHVAMYLSQELTDISLPKIGAEFGGRDHTTVMHARTKIQKMMASQRDVYNQVQHLTSTIKQKV
jgi:chromosomal replication initiator protein